jgi:hypothetical protein
MVAPDPNASPPPLRVRIAALRTRAKRQRGTTRFWSLAVALQLIDDHLGALRQRAAGMSSRPQRARIQWARRSWEQCRAAVLAALRR